MAKKSKKDYRIANKNYLKYIAANESDIVTLDNGVLYQIIERGDGDKHPTTSNVVSVHYRGWLIDGREFDSSLGNNYPETFLLRDVVEGWQLAVVKMVIGDKWRVYIPADMGYGDRTIDNIPGGSTLIFEIELIAIS